MQPFSMGNTGFERFSKTACFSGFAQTEPLSAAKSAATSPELAKLIALWPELPSNAKNQILAMAERFLKMKSPWRRTARTDKSPHQRKG